MIIDPQDNQPKLLNIQAMKTGLCPCELVNHRVWNINTAEDFAKGRALASIQEFIEKKGRGICSLCECALIASSENHRELHGASWSACQIVEMASLSDLDWGSKKANAIWRKLVDAVQPLARHAASETALKWYTSVRVLVDMFAMGQTVQSSNIVPVLDSVPKLAFFSGKVADLHVFVENFLLAMQNFSAPGATAWKDAVSAWEALLTT